ncbi:MAG: hypothetical protein ACT4QF_22365 [Sporichthyaceae bacterium]
MRTRIVAGLGIAAVVGTAVAVFAGRDDGSSDPAALSGASQRDAIASRLLQATAESDRLAANSVSGGGTLRLCYAGEQGGTHLFADGPSARIARVDTVGDCRQWSLPPGTYEVGFEEGIVPCALAEFATFRDDRAIGRGRKPVEYLSSARYAVPVDVAAGQATKVVLTRGCV